MCLLESIQMMTNTTTTTMPPPKAPQCSLPPNSSHNSNAYHSENSLQDDDQPIVLDGSCLGANLNEDSMMILSQSIDSIHTVGTNNGEGTEHQVRTLFVSGLPLDAKPRELYLLFRSFKISNIRKIISLIWSVYNKMVKLGLFFSTEINSHVH
uniref:SJCHGC04374 protein n=1 Tax=Schistosoma japonicum TaxID=6182 RepID=Q5DHX1_SCHJA|nr:SJCHGC04374 protein [Schistosoma japonicum]